MNARCDIVDLIAIKERMDEGEKEEEKKTKYSETLQSGSVLRKSAT